MDNIDNLFTEHFPKRDRFDNSEFVDNNKMETILKQNKTSRFFDEKGKLHQGIQRLICTVASGIFNCFIDPLAKCLPTNASNFLSRGLTVCSGSSVCAFGLGASTYFVSRVVLDRLQNDTHSTLRRELTDILVTAVIGAVFNVIATAIFAEISLVFVPTLIAGVVIGTATYVVDKVFKKIMSYIVSATKVKNLKDTNLINNNKNIDWKIENTKPLYLYQNQIDLWQKVGDSVERADWGNMNYTLNRLGKIKGKLVIFLNNEVNSNAISFKEINNNYGNLNCKGYYFNSLNNKYNEIEFSSIDLAPEYGIVWKFAIEQLKEMEESEDSDEDERYFNFLENNSNINPLEKDDTLLNEEHFDSSSDSSDLFIDEISKINEEKQHLIDLWKNINDSTENGCEGYEKPKLSINKDTVRSSFRKGKKKIPY